MMYGTAIRIGSMVNLHELGVVNDSSRGLVGIDFERINDLFLFLENLLVVSWCWKHTPS
jgi:hypothetical protein